MHIKSAQETKGCSYYIEVDREAMISLAILLIDDFARVRSARKYSGNDCMERSLEELKDVLQRVIQPVRRLADEAAKFDYDLKTPGNGFRSILSLFDKLLLLIVRTLHCLTTPPRWRIRFCRRRAELNLDAYTRITKSFYAATCLVVDNIHLSAGNELFPPLSLREEAEGAMNRFEQLEQGCAFGRAVGFQFRRSIELPFHVMNVALAIVGTLWRSSNTPYYKKFLTLLSCGQFVFPEKRSEYLIKLYQTADVHLFRSFWGLLEAFPFNVIRKLVGPRVTVNSTLTISPHESFELRTTSGSLLKVTSSKAHIGFKPLRVKVLSSLQRHGLLGRSAPEFGAARSLVLHCHGGGFIGTSTDTHEPYLKLFADQLSCTIVSVDYSLAPEAPYPRAIEEVLFAYAWCLSNADFLGWTGERICLIGESAGGLLLTSLCLKLIELNASRLPDALVVVYSPFVFQFIPSASRLLSLFDPLIPWQITYRCLRAYIGGQDGSQNAQPRLIENVALVDDGSGDALIPRGKALTESTQHRNQRVMSRAAGISNEGESFEANKADAMKSRFPMDTLDSHFADFLSNSESLKQSCQIVADHVAEISTKGDCTLTGYVTTNHPLQAWLSFLRNVMAYQRSIIRSLSHFINDISLIACDTVVYIFTSLWGIHKRREKLSDESRALSALPMDLTFLKKDLRSDDPFISPLLSSDELLEKMPPTSILACHMDPLLDDSISFAKRLREVGVTHTLELLDFVPHGFMNLIGVSEECRAATLRCTERVKSHLL